MIRLICCLVLVSSVVSMAHSAAGGDEAPSAPVDKSEPASNPAETASEATLAETSLSGTRNAHIAGDIVLAGQPDQEGLAELSKRGFKTVISLRKQYEDQFDEAAVCEQLGMKFIRLPIGAPDDMDPKLIRSACEILRTAGPQSGVLLHCASANRVGAVWLAHRVKESGLSLDDAKQEAAKVGLRTKVLEDKAIEYLEQ